jgi:aminoglycoside phosphotransferase (APT) family kinase protein
VTNGGVGGSDAGLRPLAGGYSGETFVAEAGGEQTVVRIYGARSAARGPNAPEIDAALLRLVRGLLPLPQVLEVRRGDPATGTPGLLVTTRLPGRRLDQLLPASRPELRRTVGANLGRVLARLAQMPMLRPGLFADGDLRIRPMPEGARDLVEWVERHLTTTALEEWPRPDRQGLLEVADRAQRLLDEVDRCCLVHSDFNPKNLLVDERSGAVTGLVDWEFAHAGLPFADLGNLLRFEREEVFAEAVLATYCRETVAPDLPAVLELARAADLWALVELAGRRDGNPVAARAHDQLRAIAGTGDLHAEG